MSWRSSCVPLLFVLATVGGSAQNSTRDVAGGVYFRDGEPVRNAAVQLEDLTTLQIVSRRADDQGQFLFQNVAADHDLQVTAMRSGIWSKSKRISKYSSAKTATVKLILDEEK